MQISAVIPSYNYAKYLSRAIDSVLAQTRKPDEIIVVDDGSTDNTREIVEAFGESITYIFQQNKGLSAARNTGIRAAKGDWIAFLDADDWWLPNKIALQSAAAERNPEVGLVYTAAWLVAPDGKKTMAQKPADPRRLFPLLRFCNRISGSGSGTLIRRDLLIAEQGFDETLTACEDWDMWVRLSRRCRFALVETPETAVSTTPNSMSSSADRMLKNVERIMEKTLLADLSGWRRSMWRRKIWGAQMFSGAVSAREAGPVEERNLLLRSIWQWPSPFFLPKRFLALYRNATRAKRATRVAESNG
jgi:glycosyltransferase involved in cell wall biosynthesis